VASPIIGATTDKHTACGGFFFPRGGAPGGFFFFFFFFSGRGPGGGGKTRAPSAHSNPMRLLDQFPGGGAAVAGRLHWLPSQQRRGGSKESCCLKPSRLQPLGQARDHGGAALQLTHGAGSASAGGPYPGAARPARTFSRLCAATPCLRLQPRPGAVKSRWAPVPARKQPSPARRVALVWKATGRRRRGQRLARRGPGGRPAPGSMGDLSCNCCLPAATARSAANKPSLCAGALAAGHRRAPSGRDTGNPASAMGWGWRGRACVLFTAARGRQRRGVCVSAVSGVVMDPCWVWNCLLCQVPALRAAGTALIHPLGLERARRPCG